MQIITEMAYPSAFSFEELNNLRTYAAKKRYLESHLERISSGSSRIVYRVDDEKVIKLAKNKKGLAQNEVEADKNTYPCDAFAKVFECDANYYWIEMEVARKPLKSEIKKLYGVPFEYITDFIKNPIKIEDRTHINIDGLPPIVEILTDFGTIFGKQKMETKHCFSI